MYFPKTYKILLVIMLILLVMGGCGSKTTEDKANPQQQTNETSEQASEETKIVSRLDELKQKFAEAGFEVGENQMVAYEMIYAKDGRKFTLDGELIEIYEYDLDNLSEEAKEVIEQAKQGSVNISGFNVPVIYKDGLMLMRHDEHSQGEKIIEIFKNYVGAE